MTRPSALIDGTQLRAALEGPTAPRVFDASAVMPSSSIDPDAEFLEAHIPGARRFDIRRIADDTSELPHMLPSPDAFAEHAGRLGLDGSEDIVVYEQGPLFSSPRAWWMFRYFGHDRVRVLDGGLRGYVEAGGMVESGSESLSSATGFVARARPQLTCDRHSIMAGLEAGATQIVDARSPGRFSGHSPEPRAGLRSGHIPGAVNLHYSSLLDDHGRLLARDELARRVANIDTNRPIVASCGSGVTACVVALALFELGMTEVSVYDGSWSEWGSCSELPVAQSSR